MFQLKWCIINSKYIFFLDLFLISTIIQIDGYNISVNFSLFTIEAYEVSIGSLEGSTDIMMPTSIVRDEVTIYIPDNVKK
jgi:hypothetical protein